MTDIVLKFSHPDNLQNTIMIELLGKIDVTNLSKVENELNPLLRDQNIKAVILNMDQLEYLNSRAVGFLANYFTEAQQLNKVLVFAALQEGVNDTLSLVGLTQLVSTFATLEEGIEAVRKQLASA